MPIGVFNAGELWDTKAFDSPLAAEWRQNNSDGTYYMVVRLFNNLGASTVQERTYVVTYGSTEAKSIQIATVAALASVNQYVVIATAVYTDQTWGWFAIQGIYDNVGVEGTAAVAAGNFLKLVTATTPNGFVKDGSTRSTASFAVALAAQGSAGVTNVRCNLFGDPAIVG